MVQVQFINKILDSQDPSLIVNNGIDGSFFSEYLKEFNYIKAHLDTYNKIPDKATFLAAFPNFPNLVVNESDNYLLDTLYADKTNRTLATSYNEIRNLVFSGDTKGAVAKLNQTAEKLTKTTRIKTVDLLQETDTRYNAYVERCNSHNDYYVSTGFKELDDITGGWDRTEELATIAARTNQGKTWIMFKSAAAAVEAGLRVGIYEGEMSARKVGYRLDTMLSHISNSGIIRGNSMYNDAYKNYLNNLHTKYPNSVCKVLTPDMIGGPATVSMLRAFIETENLDILFVDQHSLLEDERKGRGPVEKASNISKDLKNLQVLKQIPIITVSQQNRESTENGVGTEHLAQSDRIGQDSTIVLFFEQNKEHNVLTMHLVKSRDSANMKKLQYAFDFDKGIFNFIAEDVEEGDGSMERNQARAQALYDEFEADIDVFN